MASAVRPTVLTQHAEVEPQHARVGAGRKRLFVHGFGLVHTLRLVQQATEIDVRAQMRGVGRDRLPVMRAGTLRIVVLEAARFLEVRLSIARLGGAPLDHARGTRIGSKIEIEQQLAGIHFPLAVAVVHDHVRAQRAHPQPAHRHGVRQQRAQPLQRTQDAARRDVGSMKAARGAQHDDVLEGEAILAIARPLRCHDPFLHEPRHDVAAQSGKLNDLAQRILCHPISLIWKWLTSRFRLDAPFSAWEKGWGWWGERQAIG